MMRSVAIILAGWLLIGAAPDGPRILIFSHTTGYRHASIEPGIAAIKAIAAKDGIAVEASEAPALFDDPAALARLDAIVLLSTTTDPKKPESEWFTGKRREVLQGFVRGGKGIVAIHAAADSHYNWPWYGRMIGGRFQRHPQGTPTGTVTRRDARHPATAALPDSFSRTDEWYYYQDYDPTLRLLLTLDPASIGEKDANPKPMAWAHEFEGGRVFYTGLGHTEDGWNDPNLVAHLSGGLRWALGREQAPAMVIIDEAKTVRDEPPPHGNIGMSTAHRISDGVPARTMEFRRRTLHPGAAIGIHPIDHDEVYYVLSGEGEVTSDGKTARLTRGMAAYLYTGAKVGIRQRGKQPLALIISYPIAAT
jgi:type 1 glutamine amidotransferase